MIELEQRAATAAAAAKASDMLNALIVGDPDYGGRVIGGRPVSQLPDARAEARRVQELLQTRCGGGTTLLEGGDASKARVLAAIRGCDYAHLALHGAPDGVLLAGETEESGTLTMAEVQALMLSRSPLVALSACDAFKGKLSADGVIGIARAFLSAGASCLLASLWKVDDAATRVLMERFYEQLLGDKKGDAGKALQAAMISMLREPHFAVKHWAAFVAYGLPSK